MDLDKETMRSLLAAQRNELTEHIIYSKLAKRTKGANSKVFLDISKQELAHHDFLKGLTGVSVKPRKGSIRSILLMARLFGFTFAVKFMERGEDLAQQHYKRLGHIPGLAKIINDEESHEEALLKILHEERLEYAGSIVLGLNDALVELTGALAGFTLALREHRLIALAGLVTGIAAAMSMAASGYLEAKHDEDYNGRTKSPLKSATITGTAYILTVFLLVAPFFLVHSVFGALAVTVTIAIIIIAGFNFYISVAKDKPFWPEFLRMAIISLGVAAISFCIAYALQSWIGVV